MSAVPPAAGPDLTGSPKPVRSELAVLGAALEAWAEAGRVSRVSVEGESMRPLMLSGDRALVAHGREGLRRGDVLAYQAVDPVVVHRLVGCQGDRLLLAGDNRPQLDSPVLPGAVLGRVVALESGASLVALDTVLARALGMAIAVLVPLCRRRGLRRLPRALAAVAGWVLRR